MIKYNNRLLPDVGKCFVVNGVPTFSVKEGTKCRELKINIKTQKISDDTFILDNKFEIRIDDTLKKRLVNKLFSNDDQISIMLNYQLDPSEEHVAIFEYMQNWRKWFSDAIKKINK